MSFQRSSVRRSYSSRYVILRKAYKCLELAAAGQKSSSQANVPEEWQQAIWYVRLVSPVDFHAQAFSPLADGSSVCSPGAQTMVSPEALPLFLQMFAVLSTTTLVPGSPTGIGAAAWYALAHGVRRLQVASMGCSFDFEAAVVCMPIAR